MSVGIYNFTFSVYAGVSVWVGNDEREDDGKGSIIVSSLGPPNTLIRHCRCVLAGDLDSCIV